MECQRRERGLMLDEWVGREAFGLGCEISSILGEEFRSKEECLRRLLAAIRSWYEGKHPR